MTTTIAFPVFVVAACLWLLARAVRDHRAALAQRQSLLDDAAALFDDARITVAPDHFPVLVGHLPDRRRVKVELIADTLVFRRLPQLWLRVTLSEVGERCRPTIGALARPTGAEFYSLVHDMPQQMTPPRTGVPLLMRGDGHATARQVECVSLFFQTLFADPAVKEAVVTPRGTRLIRQASQGEAGAHLLLRQVRFPVAAIPREFVARTIAEAEALGAVLLDAESGQPRPVVQPERSEPASFPHAQAAARQRSALLAAT